MNELETGAVYVGDFAHQLDARNRVAVPASWRIAGKDDGVYYFAWPHPDGCIAVYPPAMWQELLEKAKGVRQSDKRGQALLRKLFGSGHRFGCDKAGRLLLPENLLKHAGIAKQVALVGLGRNFQIWSGERWEAQSEEPFDLLAAMQELDI